MTTDEVYRRLLAEREYRRAECLQPDHVMYNKFITSFDKSEQEEVKSKLSELRKLGKIACGQTINNFYISVL